MFSALIRKTEENPPFSGKILKCFNSFLASFSINKLGNNKYANETYLNYFDKLKKLQVTILTIMQISTMWKNISVSTYFS